MRLWSGGFGYTSLTCGLHGRGKREGAWAGGEEDCAVAFDPMSHGLYLLKFRSSTLASLQNGIERLRAILDGLKLSPPPSPEDCDAIKRTDIT